MRIDPAMLQLQSLGSMKPGGAAPAVGAGTEEGGSSNTFGKALMNALADVNSAQQRASDLNTRFAAGEALDVHEVMVASQEAGVMLNLATQVRNKLVEGYQEIMRTSV